MEKLICPQCGGNELQPFGAFAYKCESCGTILKDDPQEKQAPPPKTHYVAPVSTFDYNDENDSGPFTHTDGSSMDNPDTIATKVIFGIVVAVLFLIILAWACWPTTPAPRIVVNQQALADSLIKQFQAPHDSAMDELVRLNNLAADVSSSEPSTYKEKGITIKQVDIIASDQVIVLKSFQPNQHIIISLKKPKGFTREEKKVFTGVGIVVKNDKDQVMFSSDDMNKTEGDKGEDYLRYKDKFDFSLIIADSFGFSGGGNYVIEYRVWDKKSNHEITGKIPVFVTE